MVFESVRVPEERKRDKAMKLAKWSVKNRYSRVSIALTLIVTGTVFLGISAIFLLAGPSRCRAYAPIDMSMDRLHVLNKKTTEYEANPNGEIHLDGDEASFILADGLKFPVKLDVEGEQMAASLSILDSDQERCYNVHFAGSVAVDHGKATVIPSRLWVGALNLSWLTSGQTFYVDRSVIGDGAASDILQQTESLKIENGQLHIDLEDPRRLR